MTGGRLRLKRRDEGTPLKFRVENQEREKSAIAPMRKLVSKLYLPQQHLLAFHLAPV